MSEYGNHRCGRYPACPICGPKKGQWTPFDIGYLIGKGGSVEKGFACRLHPKGLCGARHVSDVLGFYCAAETNAAFESFESCPWPSRQKDAPVEKTNFDVAWAAFTGGVGKGAWAGQVGEYVRNAIRALKLDPDAPAKAESWPPKAS